MGGRGSGVGVGTRVFFSDSRPPTPDPHSLRLLLVDRDLRAVLQLAADDGVAAGDDFVARLDAVLDFDERRVGDAGFDFLHAHDVAALDEDDALQFVAALALFLFLERLIRDLGFVVVVLRDALCALLLALLGREFAVRAAHRDALNRHRDRVLHRRGLDVRGRAHARAQCHRFVRDADLHLEIRDLLLRPGVVRRGGAGDLAHYSGDFAVRIRIDADAGHVADFHVDDVVLVDVDARLHVAEVRDAHDLGAGELTRADDALAEAAGEGTDRAVGRRDNGRLRQRLIDRPQSSLGALNVEERGVERRLRDLVIRLCRFSVRLRDQLRIEERLRALIIGLGFRKLRFMLRNRRLRAAQRGLLLFNLRAIRVRLDAQQQIALAHDLPFLHRQVDDLARHLGRNLDFDLRLDLARRGDELRDVLPERLVGRHGNRLLTLLRHAGGYDGDGEDHDDADDPVPLLA